MGVGGIAPLMPTEVNFSRPKKILKPSALKPNGTIGLVSPASIVGDDEEYDKVVERIKQLGFNVKEGRHARAKYGYFAGTDKQRAQDLNTMFRDPEVDAIMPFRGGWGANRILDFIDYELIADNPKILVGYSDITSLLMAIYAQTGLVTFHGPVAKSIWTYFTTGQFQKVLGQAQPHTLERPTGDEYKQYAPHATITQGSASGRLVGGNLTVLTAMIGSEYLPDWSGNILFLEDVGEDVYRIDRMLTQLKLSGVLDRLSGFIFGQCTGCDHSEERGFSLNEILHQHIKPLGIPAYAGALIGHIDDMQTLPVGLPVTMDAEKGRIAFEESPLKANN